MRIFAPAGNHGAVTGLPVRQPVAEAPSAADLRWRALPVLARVHIACVIAVGAVATVAFFPHALPQPTLFVALLVLACLTSAWKVNLPIPLSSGATLSVSYTACLMSLLLLGPEQAILISVAGAWTQCTYRAKQQYPLYRSVFSASVAAVTMTVTAMVFISLGGSPAPFESFGSARPIVGAIATYFLVNTSLIAGVIALSTRQTFFATWRTDFLWVGASFMVAGGAGALAALIIAYGQHWKAALLIAPIYLTYRTYQIFVGRLEDHRRHTEEIRGLHEETISALKQARDAERALSAEKERLAQALTEMTLLEAARNQLLEREQAARASAEEANRLKDQFLAVVSHELRTPLNAILGWSDMLIRGTVPPAVRDRAVRSIFDSGKRQAQLIEDLLDVARIAAGKLRLERDFVDLRDVVRDALQVVQPAADVKGIGLVLDCDTPTAMVYGDAARLQQVATNLLSNATKFTPAGGTVDVRLRRLGNTAELVVSDTGQGIPPEFLRSVFEPFRQADGSTTRAHGGLGLGLSIVKNLVTAHNGTVTAHSAGQGQGATFAVCLPISTPEARELNGNRADAADDGEPASLAGISVLVVDDDDDSREMMAAHLNRCHADVRTASSAARALEIVHQSHVDVLLADIGMPVEDGYSLMRRVRSLNDPAMASIPAAAVTAFARDEDRRHALEAGFQMHLAKPIDPATLAAAVASLQKRG